MGSHLVDLAEYLFGPLLAQRGYRVFAIDVRGFGYTQRRPPYTLSADTQQLAGHFKEAAALYMQILAEQSLPQRSAEVLHVHPNTVMYRLRRVHEICGRDPHDPDDLLILFLAMKLAELTPERSATT